MEKKAGHTFGINRKYYDKVYNEANKPKQGWTEPGLYDLNTFVDNMHKKKMAFGKRLTTTEEDHKKINFPGPGSYNDKGTAINFYGNYVSSNLRNSGA